MPLNFYFLQVDRDKNIIQIFSYTKAEWLDIVEIEFYPGQFSGTEGKVMDYLDDDNKIVYPYSE